MCVYMYILYIYVYIYVYVYIYIYIYMYTCEYIRCLMYLPFIKTSLIHT